MLKKIIKKGTPFFFAFIMIAGIVFLLYPAISDYLNSKNQSKVISNYNKTVEEMPKKDYKEEFQKAYDFNKRLAETRDALYYPDKLTDYDDILNVNKNGIMGFVSIPKIEVKLPIYHNTNDKSLNNAVGHLKGSSFPVGGESTHAIIAAHRGMASAGLFTDIDKLEIGDEFTITVLDKVLIYEVDQILVVLPEETKDLEIIEGEDHVTLQTCTPYGVNSHRLLVRGVRTGTMDINDKENKEVNQTIIDTVTNKRNLIPIVIAISIVTSSITFIIIKKNKRRKEE